MEYKKIDQFIGNNLKDARLLKRMSQKDLADYASALLNKKCSYLKSISYQSVSLYEKGERSIPENVYSAFCEVLSINANALFNKGLAFARREE